jgi:hypothetical protein
MSPEPSGLDGPNLYHFVYGDPQNYVDPNGGFVIAIPIVWAAGSEVVVWLGGIAGAAWAGKELGTCYAEYKAHRKNKRKSTENKHQEGRSRWKRDQRGEKGDARRPYKRQWIPPWIPDDSGKSSECLCQFDASYLPFDWDDSWTLISFDDLRDMMGIPR